MKNYPPILKPAMELIEAQAKTISELTKAVKSLTDRVNLLSADMGYAPVSSIQSSVHEEPAMEIATHPSPTVLSHTMESNIIKPNTNQDTYYCPKVEIAGEGLAFYCDTLDNAQGDNSFFKLEVDASNRKGTFSIVSENANQFGFLTEIKDACDCDNWSGEDFNLDLVNVTPGLVVLDNEDGDEKWKVTKKAVIKFEPKNHE